MSKAWYEIGKRVGFLGVIDETMRPMLETFIFEATTILDQLDEILLAAEKEKFLTDDQINEIFRAMHTIKGSGAMMGLSELSEMTHRVEDMFFIIRDDPSKLDADNNELIFDILFQASDFLKQEFSNLQADPDAYASGDPSVLIGVINSEIAALKGEAPRAADSQGAASLPALVPEVASRPNVHTFRVFFQEDCQMENVRAFILLNQIKEFGEIIETIPHEPELHSETIKDIVDNGFVFRIHFTGNIEALLHAIENAPNIASYEEILPAGQPKPNENPGEPVPAEAVAPVAKPAEVARAASPAAAMVVPGKQSLISVNQAKLDSLVNIMGEIVIAESMVASNPDLKGLPLDNFNKSARQLRKLTDQLQDVVMSIRMVPLTGVFQKMQRIVRDMNKNLGKETDLVCTGGDTEVDKNITDVLGDPLMHMIRNSMDHGIETPEKRIAAGKSEEGCISLSAHNVGSEIIIEVADDGAGLKRENILNKAEKNGLLTKPRADYTDKEVFGMIMMPGFSTNEVVTEYSGRGVGMDVVRKNIEKVGGTISVDSKPGEGSTFTIKIPLTLAIVDGMEIGVAGDTFTIPIISISQIYKLNADTELLYDTDGTEMIMIRGECYPIVRLHRIYDIETEITELADGILIIVESGESKACIFTDKLLGEQQVVVKSFPAFFNRYNVKDLGFSGCTIMGDGSISLILDINCLLGAYRSGTQSAARLSF